MFKKLRHKIRWITIMLSFDHATKKRNKYEKDSEEWRSWDWRMDYYLSQAFDEYERYWYELQKN